MTKLKKFDKNYDLFEQKNKIRTNLIKFDKNWDQKGIFLIIKILPRDIVISHCYYHVTLTVLGGTTLR